jgi:hypothetical protein
VVAVLIVGILTVGVYRYYEGASGSDADRASDDGMPAGGEIDPQPVLTDADRVAEVLADHDGQLRQSDTVEAFDWSKSKTSRVLSEMADEGRVEKLRIGRENVIRLDSADAGEEGQ